MWASRDYVTLLIAGDSVEEATTRILDRARQDTENYLLRPGSNVDATAWSGQAGNRYSVVWNTDSTLPFEYLVLQSPEGGLGKIGHGPPAEGTERGDRSHRRPGARDQGDCGAEQRSAWAIAMRNSSA